MLSEEIFTAEYIQKIQEETRSDPAMIPTNGAGRDDVEVRQIYESEESLMTCFRRNMFVTKNISNW